jgi:hypothetical protein
LRLINAVRELNGERGTRIHTIALFTEPERHALFVREADEAVALGEAVVASADGTTHSADADLDLLERALLEARADAAWAGRGSSPSCASDSGSSLTPQRPFDIRAVMSAVIDYDHRPLERWTDMEDAAYAVVRDAHLAGYPVCLIGMVSHPLVRRGLRTLGSQLLAPDGLLRDLPISRRSVRGLLSADDVPAGRRVASASHPRPGRAASRRVVARERPVGDQRRGRFGADATVAAVVGAAPR